MMTVTFDLPEELAGILAARAAAAGQDVETFVRNMVRDTILAENSARRPKTRSKFRMHLQELIALHPPSNGTVDDSRESIYEGRGE
jgi:hypothetical protein